MKRILVIIWVGIVLSSCEGNTDYTWKIRNNSSTIVYSQLKLVNGSTPNISILPMEETAFSVLNNRGGSARPIEPKNFIETMKVYNMAQDSSLKDFRISTNWETRITRVSEIPSLFEQEYILVLEDSDFK